MRRIPPEPDADREDVEDDREPQQAVRVSRQRSLARSRIRVWSPSRASR